MTDVTINNLPDSEIELSGEIPAVDFMAYWPAALQAVRDQLTIPGFRPGHAPEKLVIEQAGEEKILFEMANSALSKAYPEILLANKIKAIGEPEISITKIAKDNPLGFKIKTALRPEVTLPDYVKIAATTRAAWPDPQEISEEEI